jgi:predicted phage terminase large subunit-like protein
MPDIIYEQKIALMRRSFTAFARFAFAAIQPNVEFETNWHIDCIAEHLEAVRRGEIKRLVINLPPRSLKSYLVSQAFPAWVLGNDPADKFINVSYGGTVVEQNALNCRRIINWPEYKQIFPEFKVGILDRILHFQSTIGGHYFADTALSSITGIGCNWMIIDDPIKPMEAMSDGVRSATNENIRSTLLNRYDDKRIGKFLMIMQRLHVDDSTGNLLKDGGYHLLKLPGETKDRIHIALKTPTTELHWDMPENSLLFPKRLSRQALDQLQLDMTPYHYAGQILQEPVPIGGGEFKDSWVNYYENGAAQPRKMNIAILADPSGGDELNKKKKKTTDYTAFMVVGLASDNNYYLLDMVRDRLNPTERIDTLFALHRKWNALTGKSPKVGYEEYSMQSDLHYINKKKREEGYNFPLVPLGGKVSKPERIRQLIPDLQNGRWYFPANLLYVDTQGRQFDLVRELVFSEMMTFPKGRFDDMVDALARIYTKELNMVFPRLIAPAKPAIVSMGESDKPGSGWMEF